jgi:hypothetical protein
MKIKHAIFTLTAALLLAACAPATPVQPTPDILAIRTSAAYTVVAEITLIANSFTPTPEPPTETPEPPTPTATNTADTTTDPTLAALGTPAEPCAKLIFDPATVDVTIPDGALMTPGQVFVKTWKIKNTGACSWGNGYGLIYSYGEKMDGQPQPFSKVVQPGEEVDVSVQFKAPDKIGAYTSAWQMADDKGTVIGGKEGILFVKIIVQQ